MILEDHIHKQCDDINPWLINIRCDARIMNVHILDDLDMNRHGANNLYPDENVRLREYDNRYG